MTMKTLAAVVTMAVSQAAKSATFETKFGPITGKEGKSDWKMKGIWQTRTLESGKTELQVTTVINIPAPLVDKYLYQSYF